jgi:hypothetical protein
LASISEANTNFSILSNHFLAFSNLNHNLFDNHKGFLRLMHSFVYSRPKKFTILGKFLFSPRKGFNESLVQIQSIVKSGFNFSKTINYRFTKILLGFKRIFKRRRAKHSFIRNKFFRNKLNKFLNSLLFRNLYLDCGLFSRNIFKYRFKLYKKSNVLKNSLIFLFESLLRKKVFFSRPFFKSSFKSIPLAVVSKIIKFLKLAPKSKFKVFYKNFFITLSRALFLSKRSKLVTKFLLYN